MVQMTWNGLLLRVLFVLAFCMLSYNSTQYNAYAFIVPHLPQIPALIGVVLWLIIALFLGWVAWDTLGKIGTALLALLVGLCVAWAMQSGLFTGQGTTFYQNIVPLGIGVVLAAGLIGGFIYRFLTGRIMVDDADT